MEFPALRIDHGGITFWLSKTKLKEILGRCRVDRQSPDNPEGYQREVTKSRAKKFGKFMQRGGVCPVNLLINIRDKGAIKNTNGKVEIRDDQDWWLVDGQHRFEGLKMLVEEDPTFREVEFPVVLLNCDEKDEAKHFLIINKMHKGVKTDLAERIFLLLELKEGREAVMAQDLPIDAWVPAAVRVIDNLVTDNESALYELIKRPGEKGYRPLNQVSVTSSLKPVIDIYDRHLKDEKQLAKALMNMWGALKELCPECFAQPKEYLLLKTPGIFVMHRIFAHLLPRLWAVKDLTKPMFVKIFTHADVAKHFDSDTWDRNNDNGFGRFGSSQKSYSIIFDLIWDSISNALDEIAPEKEVAVRM
jgi:DGQHR domain-containing protein